MANKKIQLYYTNMNMNDTGVTGSMHHLQIKVQDREDFNIIVDYGQVQSQKLSQDKLYNINSRDVVIQGHKENLEGVDVLFISHSHADHCGLVSRIPSFHEFKGRIISSELSNRLIAINLRDGCNLHIKECERYNNKKARKNNRHLQMIPYINNKITEEAIEMLQGYSFNQEIILRDDIKAWLIPSGHIAGASMILIQVRNGYEVETILFSGDTSGIDREIPFTSKPNIKELKVNHIITENTYNDRIIPKSDNEEKLEKFINETCIQNKKSIVVPVFSIQRSTVMLLMLKKVFDKNPNFNKINVVFASPMACKSHREILNPNSSVFYDEKWQSEMNDLLGWDKVNYIEKFDKLNDFINMNEPTIYLSSSGMCTGGYVVYLLTKFLTKKNNLILFCGYQGEGTLGRNLMDGIQKNISIEDGDGIKKEYPIKAKVDKFDNMSSHCDYNDLIHMYSTLEKKKIKNILITHGDIKGVEFFKGKLKQSFPNVKVQAPKYNECIKL